MSDITYIGKKTRSFESSPQFDGYSKVVITVSDDVEYAAGTDTGRTLTLVCPWGTQTMANDILSSIQGFKYQPYAADGTILDPAAELGDGVTVNDLYGGIYTMETTFGPMCSARVSAPTEEEIDHEYPYVPASERKIERQFANVKTTFKVQEGLISAEVSARESAVSDLYGALSVQADRITTEVSNRQSDVNTLISTINQQAGQIEAKVSKSGGSASSFGWVLDDSSWTIKANGTDILKAAKSGLEVYGKITATSGKIGGFDITANSLSYNNMTWGGTNTQGIYIGPNGIQLGKNFKVDTNGNLTAASGTFDGTVKAGNIQYGGSNGTLSGSALTAGSVYGGYGGAIGGSTLSTYNLAGGINTSLGYADYANGVFNGWNTAREILGTSIVSKYSLYARGSFYLSHNGSNHKVQVRNINIGGIMYGVLTI